MGRREKCSVCGESVAKMYVAMKEWSITGFLCGTCYSAKLHEHYPGEHVRVGED